MQLRRELIPNTRLREEMIQTAAVATAIVEDLTYGQAHYDHPDRSERHPSYLRGDDVLAQVADERIAQDGKWGPQHHDPAVWMLILMEEVGEAAAEIDANDHVGDQRVFDLVRQIADLGHQAKALLEVDLFPEWQGKGGDDAQAG